MISHSFRYFSFEHDLFVICGVLLYISFGNLFQFFFFWIGGWVGSILSNFFLDYWNFFYFLKTPIAVSPLPQCRHIGQFWPVPGVRGKWSLKCCFCLCVLRYRDMRREISREIKSMWYSLGQYVIALFHLTIQRCTITLCMYYHNASRHCDN